MQGTDKKCFRVFFSRPVVPFLFSHQSHNVCNCPLCRLQIVRLFAVLSHPPNLCKGTSSCQLILPALHTGRLSDIYMSSFGPAHGIAPKGKWLVIACARIECHGLGGHDEDLDALAIAKREFAALLPLLKPCRKMFADVVPYHEPEPGAQARRIHVLSNVAPLPCNP